MASLSLTFNLHCSQAQTTAGSSNPETSSGASSAESNSTAKIQPDPALKTLAVYQHKPFVTAMAALPSRNQFILVGRHLTLWSALDSAPIKNFQWPWIPNIFLVAIAVSPDEQWFVVADCLGKVYRANVGDQRVVEIKDCNTIDIVDLAISPDAQQIAVLQRDVVHTEITLLSAKTNREVRKFRVGSIAPVDQSVDILRGGNYLDYISNDKIIALDDQPSIWNATDGSRDKPLTDMRNLVALGKSSHGQIYFANYEQFVLKDPAADSRVAQARLFVEPDQLLALHPNQRLLVSLSSQLATLHDLATGKETQRLDVRMQRGNQFVGAEWLPNLNVLVVVDQHGLIRVLGAEQTRIDLELKPIQAVVYDLDQARLDLGLLPRLSGTRVVKESKERLAYESSDDLLTIETGLLRLMKADGWCFLLPRGGVVDPQEFKHVQRIERKLEFAKEGVIQSVAIGLQAESKTRTVECKLTPTDHLLPFYPGTWLVEFDSRWPKMETVTWEAPDKLKEYYDQELPKRGWMPLPPIPSPYQGEYIRPYVHQLKSLQLKIKERGPGRVLLSANIDYQTWLAQQILMENDLATKPTSGEYSAVVSYASWVGNQKIEPDFDSIDRYEAEMKRVVVQPGK